MIVAGPGHSMDHNRLLHSASFILNDFKRNERANRPPEPFVSDWQPIDPLDRLSMPRSVMQEMAAAIPDRTIKDIVRDYSGPTGPTGMTPSSNQITSVRPGGGPERTGFRDGLVSRKPRSAHRLAFATSTSRSTRKT